jgi:hypothetical protein
MSDSSRSTDARSPSSSGEAPSRSSNFARTPFHAFAPGNARKACAGSATWATVQHRHAEVSWSPVLRLNERTP